MSRSSGHLHAYDLFGEAVSAVVAKPTRALLTALGTVLGVGALVATLGLTVTARSQISAQFDEYAATEVRVEAAVADVSNGPLPFPPDSAARMERVDGVRASGLFWPVDTGTSNLRGRWDDTSPGSSTPLPVFAATPDALGVLGLDVVQGRLYDEFHELRGEPVIVLSRAAAETLSIGDVDRQPAVYIGDRAYTVIGIYRDVDRHPEVLAGAILPTATARRAWGTGTTGTHQLIVETRPGAAQVVAGQAAVALRPDTPELLDVMAPPDPRRLRSQVDDEVANLFLVLAIVSVTAGAFGIANTTLVSVLERIPEIGVRRAVGARRRDISRQFLVESAVLGTLGGIVGAMLGLLVLALVCLAKGWTATVEPYALLPTPLLGTITGLAAGLYPAIRAATVNPVEALRR